MLLSESLKTLKVSLGNYAFWTKSQPSRRRRRYSHIGFIEQLEHRTLLSGAPVFTPGSYTFDIEENGAPTIIGSLIVDDPDAELSIISGNEGNIFDVDEFADFSTLEELDYESTSTYTIEVQAENEYGSTTATVVINVTDANEPPVITSFVIYNDVGSVWVFEGTVQDEDPGSVVIYFGGILEGESVQVNADGTFSFSKVVTTTGLVTAQAIDDIQEESAVENEFVI